MPIIGVLPLVDRERESYWMLPGYLDGVLEAGGVPMMLPLTEDLAVLARLVEQCDGFLFTGGHDVAPEVYGAERLSQCGECCPARDRMETALLPLALAADRPLLGICRGIQMLNAALGGTLYQDLPAQRPSAVEHHQTGPHYERPVHTVTLLPGTPLRQLLEVEELPVNSYHHQAVRSLSPRLRPMALAPDGLVEAVWLPEKPFVWGVQWHPEFSHRTDENSRKIFRAFVAAAGEPV
ncbi:MAG: gamma-glutamyl-gamma-aminobutyrate hydrolase family protein [Clostridiales bacterium]|nr:gamma-glutamyl-gamma-aminobutyrate hydrolase family protein [Clostridiales bacterium]